jgi:hypothetical protein
MQVSRIYSPTSYTMPFIESCIQIGLSEDGACTDFVGNLSMNSSKQTVSIDTLTTQLISRCTIPLKIWDCTVYSTDEPIIYQYNKQ